MTDAIGVEFESDDKRLKIKIAPNEHVGILGITQSGKSYFARKALLTYFRRLLVIDTEEKGEFPPSSGFHQMDYRLLNPQNKELIAIFAGVAKNKKTGKSASFRWNIPWPVGQEGIERNEVLCAMLLRYGTDMALYYDEVSDFVNTHYIGEEFNALMRKSAKRHVNIIWTSQRLQSVHKDIYGNTAHVFSFSMTDYDAYALRSTLPWIRDRVKEVPFGSHRALYRNPQGKIQVVMASKEEEK